MVVGLIRDKRFTDAQAEADKQRKRAEKAEAAIGLATQKAELAVQQAKQDAEQANQKAEQERLRAQEAQAELARVRAEYEGEVIARIRRLEEAAGLGPSEPEGG